MEFFKKTLSRIILLVFVLGNTNYVMPVAVTLTGLSLTSSISEANPLAGKVIKKYVKKKGVRGVIKDGKKVHKYLSKNPIAGKITGYTKHGLNQAISRNGGRGVNIENILDAVRHPKKPIITKKNGGIQYAGKKATVVLNKKGKIITTWGKNRGPEIWTYGKKRQ